MELLNSQLNKPIITITYNDRGGLWQDWQVGFLEAVVPQAANAKTVSELRMAQALLMPLKFGLSLDDTSVALGLSKSWTFNSAWIPK